MKFKAAIFDLDGVIVDTVPLHFKAWERMFTEYGKSFSFKDYKEKVDGIPRIDGCRAILVDEPENIVKEACDKKQGYYIEYLEQEGVEVYNSTITLIKELISNNIKTAVISSSRNCPLILERTNTADLFKVRVSGNDIAKGKPDPQIFLMSAEKLQVEPSEAIVFEDAALGVEAAKRAGMSCVGIDRNNHPELYKKADIVVKDLAEVDFKRLNSLIQ
ncbi:MAG: beta-phosphoglucomutase family hydrolase [Candidatus Omnitrophota bacterium]